MFFPEKPVPVEVVRELAALLATNGLSELTLESEEEGNALRLSLGRETRVYVAPASVVPDAFGSAPVTVDLPLDTPTAIPDASQDFIPQSATGQEVVSPCVGIYRAPKKPVQVGDSVRSGQVVAIVESLRVPNEVTAPLDGKVLEISVVEGEGVEWGQTLLVLESSL